MKLRNSSKENIHLKFPGAPTGEFHTSPSPNLDVTRCHDRSHCRSNAHRWGYPQNYGGRIW